MITLSKETGPAELTGITKLELGASWDTTSGGKPGVFGTFFRKIGTDLDLVAVLLNNGVPVRFAGIDQLNPLGDHSIVHSGDNQTGHGEGDDETLTLELDRISPNVTSIVFVALAFKHGSSLDRAANVSFKVYDSSGDSKQQVADIWPSLLTRDNACAVAKVTRVGGAWALEVVNVTGKVIQGDRPDLMKFAANK